MNLATVRPEMWRATVDAKFADAQRSLHELLQSEAPEWNRYHEPGNYAAQLVGAARGVFQVTHTLVGNPQQWPWYGQWLGNRLTDDDRDMWRTMRVVRGAEEHGEGADLIRWEVPLPPGACGNEIFPNHAVLGIPTAERGTGASKSTVRFPAYRDRPASDVAREYIELCRRFADDFERDHQHLFGATTP